MLALSARLIDHGHGLLDVAMASYNNFIQNELPRTVNEMRPIVWSERGAGGASLAVTIHMQFASVQKPMLTEHQAQIMLPLQTQQLGRSYNGRLLVNIEIFVREVAADGGGTQTHHADIRDLCIGEIPILVGSCLCHQSGNGSMAHFIVDRASAPTGGARARVATARIR